MFGTVNTFWNCRYMLTILNNLINNQDYIFDLFNLFIEFIFHRTILTIKQLIFIDTPKNSSHTEQSSCSLV